MTGKKFSRFFCRVFVVSEKIQLQRVMFPRFFYVRTVLICWICKLRCTIFV